MLFFFITTTHNNLISAVLRQSSKNFLTFFGLTHNFQNFYLIRKAEFISEFAGCVYFPS